MADRDSFGAALKKARLAEAAQLEATLNIRDARALRLESLRDAVREKLAGNAKANELFDLIVLPGAKPKLWLDLISAVEMEPDPRSFRLIQDRERNREIVFETQNEAEMVDYLTRYLAHRTVLHDRIQARVSAAPVPASSRYSFWDMLYVWATGCLFGLMTFLTIAMYLGKLHF